MKVLMIPNEGIIICQVSTTKYLLEANVTLDDVIFTVNMRPRKLPRTKSGNLVRRAADLAKVILESTGGECNSDMQLAVIVAENTLNGI